MGRRRAVGAIGENLRSHTRPPIRVRLYLEGIGRQFDRAIERLRRRRVIARRIVIQGEVFHQDGVIRVQRNSVIIMRSRLLPFSLPALGAG